jgi:hypothetical protein
MATLAANGKARRAVQGPAQRLILFGHQRFDGASCLARWVG